MKIWLKILFTLFVCFVLAFAGFYVLLAIRGRVIVTRQLEDFTQKKVAIGYFAISPPLNLLIKNIEIEGLARADSILVVPSIIGLATGNIILKDIIILKPELTYEKAATSKPDLPSTDYFKKARKKKRYFSRIIFQHLSVKDGRINFTDRQISQEGIKLVINDISLNIDNHYSFPNSVITEFDLMARIPWKIDAEVGKIALKGWINLSKRDMEAKVNIEDIDGIYLYPYYSQWVDLDKTRIEKAKLDFTASIQGLNNIITAPCHLELTDLVFRQHSEQEQAEKPKKIPAAVEDIFKALDQGKIVLDFTLKTRMDKPIFGFSQIKMGFKDEKGKSKINGIQAQDVAVAPTKLLEGFTKSLDDLLKITLKAASGITNQLKRSPDASLDKGNDQ